MRKTIAILAMLFASFGILQAQNLEDFEGTPTVTAWDNATADVIDNPQPTGNASAKVLQIKKKSNPWGGSKVTLSSAIDFTTNEGISVRVYSNRVGASLMFKLEGGANPNVEVAASTTVANAWQTIKFDFTAALADKDNIVMFIDGGVDGQDNADFTLLIDDITSINLPQRCDASLSDLKYDGTDVPGEHQAIFNYNVVLAPGTTLVPVVTATATDNTLTPAITQATALPGTATILVTAADGVSTITYSINFSAEVICTLAAPNPPARAAVDVLSIFSHAYTDIAGTDFDPWWWQATDATLEDIESNSTLKYKNLNYQGTSIGTGFDASAMEYVHFDMWTHDATEMKFFLINKTPDEEKFYSLPTPISKDTWVSYDIPVSEFTSQGMTLTNVKELKFEGPGSPTIYLDNIYFWKAPSPALSDATLSDLKVDGTTIAGFNANTLNYKVALVEGTTTVPTVTVTETEAAANAVITPAASIPGTTNIVVTAQDGTTTKIYKVAFSIAIPAAAAPTPPTRATDDVVSIFSAAYTNLTGTNFNPAWGQSTAMTTLDIASNSTLKYSNLNFQGTVIETGFDATSMEYVHIDMWTNDATEIKFFPINKTPDSEKPYSLPITLGQWRSYDIPMSEFTEQGMTITNIKELKFEGTGSPTIYLDNIYFYKLPSTDATLSTIKIDNTPISNFDSDTLSYSVELPYGTTAVPVVTATALDSNSTVGITAASAITGTTSIVVTAEDGTTTKTYTVAFTIAAPKSVATLSDIKIDGTTIRGFSASKLNYVVSLAQTTTVVPTLTCTTTDSTATKVITAATAIPGTTKIVVTAQDGVTTKTYTVVFTTSPTYNVSFTVVNHAQKPLADAQVVFLSDTLVTDINGFVEFASVSPTTSATYTVSKTGYVDVTGSLAIVDADVSKKVTLEIKTYSVTFNVVDINSIALADAEVVFMSDTLKTDISGMVEFTSVSPTTSAAYTVSKAGYVDVSDSLAVIDADVAKTVTLEKLEMKTYSVTFTVVDENEVALADAEVIFNDTSISTDVNGIAIFTEVLPKTDAEFTITKEGFVEASGKVTITDADVDLTIQLIGVGISNKTSIVSNLYPNPTNGLLKIQLASDVSEATVELFDLNGKMVYKTSLNSVETTLDLRENKSGIYLIKVITENNVFNEKIVLSK
jgi:hypothetical protein